MPNTSFPLRILPYITGDFVEEKGIYFISQIQKMTKNRRKPLTIPPSQEHVLTPYIKYTCKFIPLCDLKCPKTVYCK